jgi:hypothetical protein
MLCWLNVCLSRLLLLFLSRQKIFLVHNGFHFWIVFNCTCTTIYTFALGFYEDKNSLFKWVSFCWLFFKNPFFLLFSIAHVRPCTLLLWVSMKTRILCSNGFHLLALFLKTHFFYSFQLHMYNHVHFCFGFLWRQEFFVQMGFTCWLFFLKPIFWLFSIAHIQWPYAHGGFTYYWEKSVFLKKLTTSTWF